MHQLYLESMEYTDHKFEPERKPANVVWSDETKLQSITVTMPADRNIHNKIFGGYLMRLALELAYAEAQLFTRRIPQVWAIDDISFRKPVPIGCLLELTAQVTFSPGTDGGTFEVAVEIEVIDPETRAKETANVFNLTFKSPEGVAAPRIIPRTYADLIKYVEANRRYEQHKNRFTLPREFIVD
ncbi:hypothetical protein IWQ60_011360 [Tieghemiomyces parasiticus]|uniref:HotDog ACOT-type domain-containing protein n=1 Tax=Tieghemiomyces parasiticus TaxID=78921 RepID=A0A9W7ZNG1_9FUNG|nr:hypothetical protein IWQ60_011360 [Tieghemiomyces parasiticus]